MRRFLPAFISLLALPATAGAAQITETYRVPTVDGAEISVDVVRDDAAKGKVPVVLTYSPYNTDAVDTGGSTVGDANTYVPKGYARAVADVLGTRASTGCWDYGGPKETQSGVDLVKFLAKQPWSNGNVGMIGTSYNGTTANMVAAQGDKVPELKAIVPVAGISRWYGYAYGNGVRYGGNSEKATDEGLDTPLLFDGQYGRTLPSPAEPYFSDVVADRAAACDADTHTTHGYDLSPDYDQFWVDRDYLRHAKDIKAAALVAHGWQDYNVKQEEGINLFEALPGFKRLWMTQGSHGTPSGSAWNSMLFKFFDHFLKGEDTGIEDTPLVTTLGRSVGDDGAYVADAAPRTETSWPPAGVKPRTLYVRRSFVTSGAAGELPPPGYSENGTLDAAPETAADSIFTWFDTGLATEELSTKDPTNEPGHGYYSLYEKSAPMPKDTRMVGAAVLDAYVRASSGSTLTPVLVDVTPSGTFKTIARGFLNLDYRDGLDKAKPAGSAWVHAVVKFLPQDTTIRAGHRIGLLLQSSNTVWAVPGTPGEVNIAMGPVANVTETGSKLVLPIVGG
jgi:X-Pro dipeptidyl-peptidase